MQHIKFRRIICLFLMPGLLLAACGRNSYSPLEYIRWVESEESGMKSEKTIGDYRFSLLYKPADYMIIQEYKSEDVDKTFYEKRFAELKDFQYFNLSIASADEQTPMLKCGLSNEEDYYRRLRYFSADVQKDLVLVEGNDTLECLQCHFEQNYGLAAHNTMVLVFERKPVSAANLQKTLVYKDKVLGTGTVCLGLDGEQLSKDPKINYLWD